MEQVPRQLVDRSDSVKRVSLIGPECSGKTTLARKLAKRYQAPWSEEYARVYAEKVGRPLTREDVDPIAKGELRLIEQAIKRGGDLIIHDTDLLSTLVYAEYYYWEAPEWVEENAWIQRADLYLLMSAREMEHDGVRDGEADRAGITELFTEKLLTLDLQWFAIGEEPFESAVQVIDDLLRG